MFFKQGEYFEVSGRRKYHVFYADEEKAIVVPVAVSMTGAKLFCERGNFVSNKEDDYNGHYWIIKLADMSVSQFSFIQL